MERCQYWRWGWLLSVLLATVAQGQTAVPVELVSPSQSAATRELRLSGTLVAVQRSQVSARVDGAVASMQVDAGAEVKQGQLLLELDASLEQHEHARLAANVAAAQAQVDEHQRLVNEALRLTRDNHLPQNELALRQAALASSQAALDAAKAQLAAQQQRLDWHHIKAPFAGVVVQKLTEVGEWVTRGTPVLELVATRDLYLDVQVPQEQYGDINGNTEILIRPDVRPDLALPGRIVAQVPVADAASRTFRLRLVSTEPSAALLPGASARAILTFKQDGRVLTVPRDALLRNPDGGFSVFTVVENGSEPVAQRRQVILGRNLGEQVEVLSGLPENEPVVVRGNEILRQDQPVRVVNGS
ncbi:MAG: efflux RND transporter periplasmic adaptor subunit [Pseudomonadota bacterium]|nr:efflux RND transporter periplasmic adaptor subunit [Pseudomonadota bacterium]